MKKIFIVLGNQLFNPSYFEKFRKDHLFFICEDFQLCTYQKHHKHKILLFLSAMRSFADELKKKKFEIIYKSIEGKDFKESYVDKLFKEIEKENVKEISMFEVEDKFFEKQLLENLKELKLNYLKSPMFLSSRDDFKTYLNQVKKPFMANFYKKQRVDHNILVDSNSKPVGGKWSFDDENRKKLPKEIDLPEKFTFKETKHTKDLKEIVEKIFSHHPGNTKSFWTCTNRKDTESYLDYFLDKKIENFGDYEDAVDQRAVSYTHLTLPTIRLV